MTEPRYIFTQKPNSTVITITDTVEGWSIEQDLRTVRSFLDRQEQWHTTTQLGIRDPYLDRALRDI